MKVLQINATYGIGSTGVIVKDIHELALKEGVESYVAYSMSAMPPSEIVNGYKIGTAFGKKLHALLCRINGMQGYFSRFATKKLLKHIKYVSPDIVQLHNLHSNYINLPMLLKYLAKANIRTVVTLHDCWFFTGGCFHYTAVGCDRWKNKCGSCPKKKMDTRSILFDRSAKILRDRKRLFEKIENLTVVGVSDWITQESVKSVFVGRKAIAIHNGVDTQIFKAVDSDFRKRYNIEDKFIILGPATKWLSKVNKTAFESMVESLKDEEVFVLLGCSNEQLTKLPKNVIGLPFIKNRIELCEIYSAADVFINPTHEDTFPFANLEPQACGTPVITYRNTGAKETVDGVCGFAVENEDFLNLIDKKAFIKRLGKAEFSDNCVRWVHNNFSAESNYRKYINWFK